MTDETLDRPRTYVGAYALCVADGQMLLVRIAPGETEAGGWTLPGGGLLWGEDPADCVLRELTEETGLSGRVVRLAGIFSAQYRRSAERPRDSVHHIGIVYFVHASPGEVRHEQDGSTDRAAWFPLDELKGLPLVAVAEYGRRLALNP